MTTWEPIPGTEYPDQRGEVAFPFYAEVGPAGSNRTWTWSLLRANNDGTSSELTGGTGDSEEMAKLLAEAAGMGALAQFETDDRLGEISALAAELDRLRADLLPPDEAGLAALSARLHELAAGNTNDQETTQ